MTPSPARPVITDTPERERYEAHLDGQLAGILDYRLRPGRINLIHTEVLPIHEGKGVGSALVRFALDDARRRGLSVIPTCPYVRGYLRRHPEEDLVVGRS
jgi:predicted GNAT family acetyltransferase